MGAAAFLSYAHGDNDREEGRLLQFLGLVAAEFELISAQDFQCFTDQNIEWGETWRERIDAALGEATFLVPIVTPRFLQSTECRRELLAFVSKAKSLGREDFLLPVLWVNTDLAEDSDDEVIRAIAATQYVNWTEHRLQDKASEAHRRAIADLATRLVALAEDITAPRATGDAALRSRRR